MSTNKTFFHFHDENTCIDYRIPISCSEEEWDQWFESEIELADNFVGKLEEVAVHDVDGSEEEDGTVLIGFTSYEAEDQKTIDMILEKWKEKLVELGWANKKDSYTKIQL